MALDFSQLLAKPTADIKRPPALPEGSYHGTIKNYKFEESRFGLSKDDPTKYGVVVFTFHCDSADQSIDPSMLADADGKALDLNRRPHTREMPISGGNEYITVEFLKSLGIPQTGTLGEMIQNPAVLGAGVTWDVTQRPDKNNAGVVYNDVKNVRPRAQ